MKQVKKRKANTIWYHSYVESKIWHELIYETETDSERTDLRLARGKGDRLRVTDEQMQTSKYRMDKQQGPTVYTGNYIQYPVINHNEKESKKDYIYV